MVIYLLKTGRPKDLKELYVYTKIHRGEVRDIVQLFCLYLLDSASKHDSTKFENMNVLFDFMNGNKDNGWNELHMQTERHHLFNNNLSVSCIDVIEMVCDWLSAGNRYESISFRDYALEHFSEDSMKSRLLTAFFNTDAILKRHINVIDIEDLKTSWM